jgi:hypothetical protein
VRNLPSIAPDQLPAANRQAKPTANTLRIAEAVLLAAAAYLVVNCLVTAWFSKAILDGESSGLLSIAVAVAENGKPYYRMYDYFHQLFGFSNTVVHPPLHYFLEGLVLSSAGYGPLQYTATNMAVTLAGLFIASAVCARFYGAAAAAFVFVMAAALRFLYDPATGARSDVLLGFLYLLTVLACGGVIFARTPLRSRIAAFLAGLFAAASLAAHYYGIMTLGLALVLAVVVVGRDGPKAWPAIAAGAAGGLAGLGLWYLAYGPDFLKIGPVMYLVAAVADMRLDIPFRAFWAGVIDMPGGWIFLSGIILFSVHLAVRSTVARSDGSMDDRRLALEALLLGAAVWPIAFLWLFTDNHNYRYWIDLIFVGLIVSAAGLSHALTWISRPLGNGAATARLAGSFAVVIADITGNQNLFHDQSVNTSKSERYL